MDCPFCNGRNTLSIDTTENKIGWYCFHASCSAKGKQEGSDLLPTGYMIFLEYGTPNIRGQRNLDKAESKTFPSVMSSIVPSLRSIIDKRFKKKGL